MEENKSSLFTLWQTYFATVLLLTACACTSSEAKPRWEVLVSDEPGALLSVWGASASDVWVVGSDALDGTGPIVLRIRDEEIERVATGLSEGDLWWVHGFAEGPIFMGGSGGVILRFEDGVFTKQATPSNRTIYGLWGSSPSDMWAVGGGSAAGGGFAWRLAGEEWVQQPGLPREVEESGALWKIHGTSATDAWLVGSQGYSFHWDGTALVPVDTGVGSSLFTVVGSEEEVVAVGGLASGIIVEYRDGQWTDHTPDPLPQSLTGLSLDAAGGGFAVGSFGSVYERRAGAWQAVELGFQIDESLHAVWIDPEGGVWAVGGLTYASPLTQGVVLHRGGN